MTSRNAACAYSAAAISSDVPRMSRANSSRSGPTGAAVRGVRAATYASYFARCAGDAESVGITTSPCDTRAAAPAGCESRKVLMWDSCTDAKSSGPRCTASSAFSTDETRKFTPFSPAHFADASDPPPYHIRARSPGECGSTREENCSNPSCRGSVAAVSPATNRSSRETRS